MHRFYLAQTIAVADLIDLPLEIVHHLWVLRIKTQQQIELFNGDGYSYISTLINFNKKFAQVIINKQKLGAIVDKKIHLACSLIANDKFILMVQKVCELGVNEITPIVSTYTQKNHKFNSTKLAHLQQVIFNSCAQCGQNLIPTLNQITDFKDFVAQDNHSQKYILSPHHPINNSLISQNQITILIGPEGGFTELEIDLAYKYNYIVKKLGNLILRSETAAIVSCAYFQFL